MPAPLAALCALAAKGPPPQQETKYKSASSAGGLAASRRAARGGPWLWKSTAAAVLSAPDLMTVAFGPMLTPATIALASDGGGSYSSISTRLESSRERDRWHLDPQLHHRRLRRDRGRLGRVHRSAVRFFPIIQHGLFRMDVVGRHAGALAIAG